MEAAVLARPSGRRARQRWPAVRHSRLTQPAMEQPLAASVQPFMLRLCSRWEKQPVSGMTRLGRGSMRLTPWEWRTSVALAAPCAASVPQRSSSWGGIQLVGQQQSST